MSEKFILDKKLKVYAALREDIQQGWVWIDISTSSRIVKITNKSSKKVIYCEVLSIDDNFKNKYGEQGSGRKEIGNNVIVISEWYRKKLKAEKNSDLDFKVEECDSWCGSFKSCLDHPQAAIRLATKLGATSLVLGALSLLLGAWSIYISMK